MAFDKNTMFPCSTEEQKTYFNGLMVSFGTMLDAVCPPAIKMMIGEADTDQICDTAPFEFTLTKLMIQCVDITTHTKGSLASEITITVYVNGVAKFSAISTATDTLVESVLATPVSIAKGDVFAIVPSAAPGTGKQVSINLVGTW